MRSLSQFTDASITDFLLSPLLVKKGDRPSLVRKLKPQHTSKSRAVITAAATVARKPCSPPANLPIIQGNLSFRLSSLPHPPAPSRCPLLFIRDPMIYLSSFFLFCSSFYFLYSRCYIMFECTLIFVKTEDGVELAATTPPIETRLGDDGVRYT